MESDGVSVTPRFALPLTVACSTLAVMLSMTPWVDLYVTGIGAGPPFVLVAVGIVVSVVVTVAVTGVWRRRFAVSAAVSVAAFMVFTLVAVVQPRLSVAALFEGYTQALDRVLTSAPPLLVTGGVLVPVMTVVWLVAAVNTELLYRTRVVAGLLAGPVALLIFAQVIATRPSVNLPGLAQEIWLPLSVLALLGLMVVFRHQSLDAVRVGQPSASERRAMWVVPAVGVLLITLAVSLAVVARDWLPAASQEASLEQTPPIDISDSGGPVETFAAIRNPFTNFGSRYHNDDGGDVLLRVETSETTLGYFTITSLSDYDGATWNLPDESLFSPIGFQLSAMPNAQRQQVVQTYTVEAGLPADQPWLVTIDQPIEVLGLSVAAGRSGADALANAGLGILRSPAPLVGGDSYSIRSVQARQLLRDIDPSTELLGSVASPSESTRLAPSGAVGTVVEGWQSEVASSPGVSVDTFGANLRSLQQVREFLAAVEIDEANGPVSVAQSTRSLSLSTLDQTFGGDLGAVTPEQIASQFALIARSLGFPSRVATGFRLRSEDGSAGLSAGTYELRSTDLWTWGEVFIGDLGWVVVDPATESGDPAASTPEGVGIEDEVPPIADASDDEGGIVRLPSPVVPEPQSSSGLMTAVLFALLVVPVAGVVVFGRRRRRRSRRRRGEPVQSVLGAWHEVLDVLDESRVGPLRASSGSETVASVRERFGDSVAEPVSGITMLADPAVFSDRVMTPHEAEAAWLNLEAVRASLKKQLTVRQRFGALLRSLRPRRLTHR